jgi:hypothetical protein
LNLIDELIRVDTNFKISTVYTRYPSPFVPQVKEAAEQARAATVATGAVAGTAEAARNVAQAFAQPEEEEPQRPAPLGTTLSSLLTLAEQQMSNWRMSIFDIFPQQSLGSRFQGFWDGCWLLGRLQCGRSGVSASNALVLVWVPVWFLGLVPDGSGNFRAGSSV